MVPDKGFLEVLTLNGIKLTPTVARQLIQKSQCNISNPLGGMLINYKNALRMIHIDADATPENEGTFEDMTWVVRDDLKNTSPMGRTTTTFYHNSGAEKGQTVKKMTLNAIE